MKFLDRLSQLDVWEKWPTFSESSVRKRQIRTGGKLQIGISGLLDSTTNTEETIFTGSKDACIATMAVLASMEMCAKVSRAHSCKEE